MNKQSSPAITWALAFAFVTLASIQIGATPRFQARQTAPQKAATKTARSYACPMHPEVTSTRKGKCPKCKMDLQPVRETSAGVTKPDSGNATGETTIARAINKPPNNKRIKFVRFFGKAI